MKDLADFQAKETASFPCARCSISNMRFIPKIRCRELGAALLICEACSPAWAILVSGVTYMANGIKAGDVVQLKSGGPKMTVTKVEEWMAVMRAHCEWFVGDANKRGNFPLTSLKRAE
jgi:uncharacterized protein YodC (DUF2158 family)